MSVPTPSPSIDRAIESRLRDAEVRYTRGRRAVVAALEAADGPRSAAELHESLDVPLSSLYRSLSTLEEAGVLAPHNSARGITRYELGEWLRGHHHHLVCTDCGVVDDIALADEHERQLERLVERISATAGYDGRGHTLEIEGRCERCA